MTIALLQTLHRVFPIPRFHNCLFLLYLIKVYSNWKYLDRVTFVRGMHGNPHRLVGNDQYFDEAGVFGFNTSKPKKRNEDVRVT